MSRLTQETDLITDHNAENNHLLPLDYNFRYENISFDCRVFRDKNNGISVSVDGKLGYLPYSSENTAKRAKILNAFGTLIARGKIVIDHHCTLTLPATTMIGRDLNAEQLIKAITFTLLDNNETIKFIKSVMEDDI